MVRILLPLTVLGSILARNVGTSPALFVGRQMKSELCIGSPSEKEANLFTLCYHWVVNKTTKRMNCNFAIGHFRSCPHKGENAKPLQTALV